MNLLSVERVAKRHGPRLLFQDVSFGLEKGERLAIVARNGAGKSTLLRCIAGVETPDEGQVTCMRGTRVGYLPQDVTLTGTQSLVDEMLDQDEPVSNAIRAYEHAIARGTHGPALQQVIDRMEELHAWDHEARVKRILYQFGLRDLEQPVNTLSGGQQKRLALAKVLVNKPDLLILDEPTNHLDLGMIEQLEQELMEPGITLLLVTHDRYFLDRVCDVIMEMDDGEVRRFKGNYSYYVEKKALLDDVQRTTQDRLQGLMRRELEWVRRMPRARGTKSKSRMAAFEELKADAAPRRGPGQVDLEVNVNRLGGKVIEVRNLGKSLGDRLIVDRFNCSFKRGDRIGLVGPNGVGKSTLIELITGRMAPDRGKVSIGETVELGVFDQRGLQLPEDKHVIEVVRDIAEVIPLAKGRKLTAAQLLERFLFPKEQHFAYASTLSGGERRRLHLCTVLMRNPNVLVLDEPTNDLDIPTINALEEFLEDLDVCLIVVSHDRFFLDKVCRTLLVFEGNGVIREFAGSHAQLREQMKAGERAATEAPRPPPPLQTKPRKIKLTYAERLELDRLQSEIPALEQEQTRLTVALSEAGTGHEELARRALALEECTRQLERMSERWLELEEKATAGAH